MTGGQDGSYAPAAGRRLPRRARRRDRRSGGRLGARADVLAQAAALCAKSARLSARQLTADRAGQLTAEAEQDSRRGRCRSSTQDARAYRAVIEQRRRASRAGAPGAGTQPDDAGGWRPPCRGPPTCRCGSSSWPPRWPGSTRPGRGRQSGAARRRRSRPALPGPGRRQGCRRARAHQPGRRARRSAAGQDRRSAELDRQARLTPAAAPRGTSMRGGQRLSRAGGAG